MSELKPCPFKKKGKPSIEWYKDGKPQYYCMGYIDKMTDDFYADCYVCKKFVGRAQEDLEVWNRRAYERPDT